MQVQVINLIKDAAAPGVIGKVANGYPFLCFFGYGSTTAGSGTAVFNIEASNDGVHWITLSQLSVTIGTSGGTNRNVRPEAWRFVRASVYSLSGTGAKASMDLCYADTST